MTLVELRALADRWRDEPDLLISLLPDLALLCAEMGEALVWYRARVPEPGVSHAHAALAKLEALEAR